MFWTFLFLYSFLLNIIIKIAIAKTNICIYNKYVLCILARASTTFIKRESGVRCIDVMPVSLSIQCESRTEDRSAGSSPTC